MYLDIALEIFLIGIGFGFITCYMFYDTGIIDALRKLWRGKNPYTGKLYRKPRRVSSHRD